MTNCPGLTDFTARPTSATTPQYSCPMGEGPLIGWRPRYGHRSDPHTHVAAMRMTASVGSSTFGASRSSKRTSRGPYNTVPFMAWLLVHMAKPRFLPGFFSFHSSDRHPTVHREGVADDVARAWTAQPQHDRGDLFGPSRAANGDVLRDLAVRLLVPGDDVARHLRVDQPGVHGVDPDAPLDVFQSRRPRQADHAVLGGDVGADPGVAGQRADRGVVDDRAASLALHLPQLVLHAAPHAAQVDPDHAIPLVAGTVGGRDALRHDAC